MISEAANLWLRTGERGISSEAIFSKLTGIHVCQDHGFSTHPVDPDDFQRCEMLLRAVSEFRPRMTEMGTVSPVWQALVHHWSEIAALLESEVPGVFEGSVTGRAPKTYELMKGLGC